jgi:hypothetical protein
METKTGKRRTASETGIALSPELFAGERILGTIEAGVGDLGWLGYLLRRKACLVVTTHRLLQYSTDFMSANVKSLELAKVEAIEAGNKFEVVRFAAGVILLLGAVLLAGGAISQHSGKLLFTIGSSASALAGLFALMTSEKKVLQALSGGTQSSIRLTLSRLNANESKSFIDLVSKAVRNLSQATAANSAQSGRKPDEPIQNLKNGDDKRTRTSRPKRAPQHQPHPEPEEEPRESLNGRGKPYQGIWKTPERAFGQTPPEFSETQEMPADDDDYLEYRTSPSGEGWYRTSSRRMYIE